MARHEDARTTPLEELAPWVAEIEARPMPELLAPTRVAAMLDMNRRRVYELVESGDLAAVRLGRRGLRIFRASLLDWLRRGGCGGLG